MTHIRIQMDHELDGLSENGEPRYRMPYPFYVNEDGYVAQQDFWQGKVYRVIGFQKDVRVQRIDLWWGEAFKAPESIVGMYLVTSDDDGNWGTFQTAVIETEITES